MPPPEPPAGGGPDVAEIFAALPVAVIVATPCDSVAHVNALAEEMLNQSERMLLGQPLAAILPRMMVERPPTDQGVAVYDLVAEMPQGQRLRIDFAAGPIADRPGWRLLTLHHAAAGRAIGADRTAGARAAIGAAAMLAHEIKNPLAGIRGAAQLLGSGELTSLIVAEVDRIAALIDRMEEFGDDRPLPLTSENIYPLLSHVTTLASAGLCGAPIEERYDPSLPPALVNRDALVQVLLNLLKNAGEAVGARPDGRVTIATAYRLGVTRAAMPGWSRSPLPIEIVVVDNGPGAPSDIASHLFEPFVSGRPEGRGLGLALVDKLVGAMGGIVQYAREGDPPSTVFRLLLPRGAA